MVHARLLLAASVVLNVAGESQGTAGQINRTVRTIGTTVVVEDIDVGTLQRALEVLPRQPKRIEILRVRTCYATNDVADVFRNETRRVSSSAIEKPRNRAAEPVKECYHVILAAATEPGPRKV
jgi:hypothetical protein